jgi:hypothetical protein
MRKALFGMVLIFMCVLLSACVFKLGLPTNQIDRVIARELEAQINQMMEEMKIKSLSSPSSLGYENSKEGVEQLLYDMQAEMIYDSNGNGLEEVFGPYLGNGNEPDRERYLPQWNPEKGGLFVGYKIEVDEKLGKVTVKPETEGNCGIFVKK